MNRSQKLRQWYDHSAQLVPTNPWYREQLQRYSLDAIQSDASKDITSKLLVKRNSVAEAIVVSHAYGRLAGMQELRWIAKQLNITIKTLSSDGIKLVPNQIIARLSGKTRMILQAERTILNIIQRMSGIATLTANLVKQTHGRVQLCATRKTVLGALDKRAVAVGGGLTHRLGLFDSVLVKDNHLALLQKGSPLRTICFPKTTSRTIEVSSVTQLKYITQQLLDYDIIMFDNFTSQKIKQAVTWLKKVGLYRRYLLEASGGVHSLNLKQFVHSGVVAVSLGCLTHSVASLDISLELYQDE